MFADHPPDTVYRFGWPGEGDHGRVGGHDVIADNPKARAPGDDPVQLRRPLPSVALPEAVFGTG